MARASEFEETYVRSMWSDEQFALPGGRAPAAYREILQWRDERSMVIVRNPGKMTATALRKRSDCGRGRGWMD